MLKIRLARVGAKNDPHYRVVVIEEKRKREGKSLEIIGHWHPAKGKRKIDHAKLKKWVSLGAKKTKAVDELVNQSK
jgi:small subunit ribosomal protein S16